MEKYQNYKADLVVRSAELAAALSAGGKEISDFGFLSRGFQLGVWAT